MNTLSHLARYATALIWLIVTIARRGLEDQPSQRRRGRCSHGSSLGGIRSGGMSSTKALTSKVVAMKKP